MTQAQLLTYKCPHCGQSIDVDAAQAEHTITCPNPLCHKPFKLEVPAAQPMPNLVISPGLAHEVAQVPLATNGEAVRAAPDVETDLLTVHPMMFRRYPFRSVAYALIAVLGLGFLLAAVIKGGLLLGLLGVVMVAFGMFHLGLWWLRMIGTSITVTTKRTLLRTGALHSQVTEVPHKEVAEIAVHQNLLGRLMGVGDIALVTRSQDKKGVLLMGLPDPEEFAQQIRTRRQL
ncbi:MAG TPA: PH domain-containing protein [Gemmataceae bacterium]|nr:PH domain-containing protein [Gemmataceae bacterium]